MGVNAKIPAIAQESVNQETSARSTDGRLVYAVGDIHGRYDLLKSLLAQIAADASSSVKDRKPFLIFCGDYVDRGPQSAEVIQALVWLSRRMDFDVRILKGNHEAVMLHYIEGAPGSQAWLDFGGNQTLRSYGVEPPDAEDSPSAHFAARDLLLDKMPASHLQILRNLKLIQIVGDYAFVHAGVRPGAVLAAQTEQDMLWIRQGFLDRTDQFEKIIVHGHTWVDAEPDVQAHRIGIDTGAYSTGVLTALRLNDGEMSFLQGRE